MARLTQTPAFFLAFSLADAKKKCEKEGEDETKMAKVKERL
jgi:hypothetical protein